MATDKEIILIISKHYSDKAKKRWAKISPKKRSQMARDMANIRHSKKLSPDTL